MRRELEANRLRQWIGGLAPDARILDAECGDGMRLDLIRSLGDPGWRVEGLTRSAPAARALRLRGLAVQHGSLDAGVSLEPAAYDLVLLVAVLEGVDDPVATLEAARELLAPGGRVAVVAHNTDTPAFRLFGNGYWGGYRFPHRFHLYDPRSLRRVALDAGLIEHRVTTAASPDNWRGSVRNALLAHDAPGWLVGEVAPESSAAAIMFTAVDAVCSAFGRGALLTGTFACAGNRPSEGRGSRPRSKGNPPRPIILGAGFAGLVAGRELARRGIGAEIFEAAPQVGGLARSFKDADGFSYDFGAHFITNRLAAMLGVTSRCRVVHRCDETVCLRGDTFSYPLGLLRSPGFVGSAIAARARSLLRSSEPETAGEWFEKQYGRRLARDVAVPLLEAWSGAPADQLAASVGDKLPGTMESTWLKLASRLSGRAVGCGYTSSHPENWNVWHVYPQDGVGSLVDELAGSLASQIHVESPVEAIHVEDGAVTGVTSKGRFLPATTVFSTAPVHILARLVKGADMSFLTRFKYRPMIFVNLMLEGRGWLPSTMCWTPEARYPFFRLVEAPLSMPWLAPEGQTIITADIGTEVGDPLWMAGDEELADLCLSGLADLFPSIRAAYRHVRVLRTPFAYPVYLKEYEAERRAFLESSGIRGLYSIGRNGRFSHDLMEDVFWTTRMAVNAAVGPLSS